MTVPTTEACVSLNIGVVGHSKTAFDEGQATRLLDAAFDAILADNPTTTSVAMVSGLTDVGVPALAYRLAATRGWYTVGISCAKAVGRDCYPVDERLIIGEDWGDESEVFLSMVDVLIRVGGGAQSHAEAAQFAASGGTVYEHDLDTGTA
jgi:hypothetical protein